MTGRTRTVIAAACVSVAVDLLPAGMMTGSAAPAALTARVSMPAGPCFCFTPGGHGAPVVVADGSAPGRPSTTAPEIRARGGNVLPQVRRHHVGARFLPGVR